LGGYFIITKKENMEIADLVLELNHRYGKALNEKELIQKGQRSRIFLGILESLYNEYGEYLGYDNFSDFKSLIVRAKNCGKNNQIMPKIYLPFPKRFYFEPTEGSGAIFTEWQISKLDLNPDSY